MIRFSWKSGGPQLVLTFRRLRVVFSCGWPTEYDQVPWFYIGRLH